MIETSLNVTDYPEPPEPKEKHVKGTITLTYELDADVPEEWDNSDVENDIKQNLIDYVGFYDYVNIDIDI